MKKAVLLLMAVSLVCVANAATIRYQNSGDWFDVDTSDGNGWQGGVLPGSLDQARANWGGWVGNTITLGGAAPSVQRFQLGVDESGTLVVNNGGSITSLADSKVGNNNWVTGKLVINAGGTVTNTSWFGVATGNGGTKAAGYDPSNPTTTWGATYGVVEINGGTLNITSHLWMATGGVNASNPGGPTSIAFMTINDGGVVNVGGNLGLGTINASTPSAGGGVAVINVNDGGLLNLYQWSSTTSIMDGSVLNINGTGTVIVGGNRGAEADAYFALGKIASDLGGIQWVYTPGDPGQDYTTITAIPEPATVALLGLGALGLLRKKK